MTRINVGVPVEQLCDQHLVAEYRELPRMVGFACRSTIVLDMDFRLNAGHMKSCVRYGAYLAERHEKLVEEMRHRGFKPKLPPVKQDQFPSYCQRYPSVPWLASAEVLVRVRITNRLMTMKRQPTWSKQERPPWSRLQVDSDKNNAKGTA